MTWTAPIPGSRTDGDRPGPGRRGQDGVVGILIAAIVASIGAALVMSQAMTDRSTRDRDAYVAAIAGATDLEDAIVRFVVRNRRLPRPADNTVGLRAAAGAGETVTVGVGGVLSGALPWQALGLQAADALDAWRHRYSYRVSQAATAANAMDYSGCQLGGGGTCPVSMTIPTDRIDQISDLRGDFCRGVGTAVDDINAVVEDYLQDVRDTIDGSGIAVNLAGTAITAAGFALISHGANGNWAFSQSGTQAVEPQTTGNEFRNSLSSTLDTYVDIFRPAGSTNPFDDIVDHPSVLEIAAAAGLWQLDQPIAQSDWPADVTDALACVGEEGGEVDEVSLDDDPDAFVPGGSGGDDISITPVPDDGEDDRNILNVGTPGDDEIGEGTEVRLSRRSGGCVWIDVPLNFTSEILRAYWEFRIYGSAAARDGFTFGMIPGATSLEPETLPCGNSRLITRYLLDREAAEDPEEAPPGMEHPHLPNGSDLAFVGAKNTAYPDRFPGSKMAVEFDLNSTVFDDLLAFLGIQNTREDPNTNHIAMLRENSTIHGSSICGTNDLPEPDTNWFATLACVLPWYAHRDWCKCPYDWTAAEAWGTNPSCSGGGPGMIGCYQGPIDDWLEDRDFCNIQDTENCCADGDIECCVTDDTENCCAVGDDDCLDHNPGAKEMSESPYRIRVEVMRRCDAGCETCAVPNSAFDKSLEGDGQPYRYVHWRAWIDCAGEGCRDVSKPAAAALSSSDYAALERLDYCMLDPGYDTIDGTEQDFNTVKVGLTMASRLFTSGMQVSRFIVSNVNSEPWFVDLDAYDPELGDAWTDAYLIGGPPIRIDRNVEVHDHDLDARNRDTGNYNGAVLTLEREATASPDDQFGFDLLTGFEAGETPFTVDGDAVLVSGAAVATIDQSDGVFELTFTAADGEVPTTALVTQLLRRLTYEFTGSTPPEDGGVTLEFEFDDGTTNGLSSRVRDTVVLLVSATGGG